jgi:hypothetical protein
VAIVESDLNPICENLPTRPRMPGDLHCTTHLRRAFDQCSRCYLNRESIHPPPVLLHRLDVADKLDIRHTLGGLYRLDFFHAPIEKSFFQIRALNGVMHK